MKNIIVSIVLLLFLASCEENKLEITINDSDLNTDFCYENDCISALNSNIVNNSHKISSIGKSSKLSVLVKKKFRRIWKNTLYKTYRQKYGNPAWRYLESDKMSSSKINYHYLPIIKRKSESIEAVAIITHNHINNSFDFDIIPKSDVKNLPLILVDKTIARNEFATSYNLMFVASIFFNFNKSMFNRIDDVLLSDLPVVIQNELLNKDVVCSIRTFVVTTCQDIVGGQNGQHYLYTDCKQSIETVTGCSGGTGTLISAGTTGGGSSSGSTSGTINTTTSDRCSEDGVGCEIEYPDCETWDYSSTSNPNSYACGVRGLSFYYVSTEGNWNNVSAKIVEYTFSDIVYFEFPTAFLGRTTPGQAASITADAMEDATQTLKRRYGIDPPRGNALQTTFLSYLNEELSDYGAKATFNNYYNTTSINNYQWQIGGVNNSCR